MSNPLTIIPYVKSQFFDNNGDPLNGGFLYAFASGSSTPQDTYSNATGTTNTNPVELDSAGRAVIFLAATSYKFRLEDADHNIIWTVDGVPSTGLSQSIVGIGGLVWSFGGSQYTSVTNTSYVSGSTYDACDTDTTILSIDSSLLVGSFALSGMMYAQSGITMTAALVNLSDGSPDTPIATISTTSAVGVPVTSTAISFGAPGVAKLYALKSKVSSGRGFRWGVALKRIA